MRLYPDVPSRRLATLARDLLFLVVLVFLVWLGLTVRAAVDGLAVLGDGVSDAGGAVRGGFDAAAEAVDGAPLVGGRLADGLRAAGEGTGGNTQELGREGADAAHRLADILGLIVFGMPGALVLGLWLPARVAQVRALSAAARVLHEPESQERRRLVAMRAVFSLPYGQLLRHTGDPLGDLAAERYDPLIEAALEDAGLRARTLTS
ncbi:MAG: hypothetical protein H0T39_02350 [Actinobacteria bacterium]|nr:hypothetical protein [Actinomycetota bacterium]